VYAVTSSVYRLTLAWAITVFVWTRVPVVGTVVGIIAFITLLVVPIGALVWRIVMSDEVAQVRGRAVGTTAGAVVAGAAALGLVPVPHVVTVTGVVEPSSRVEVHAIAPGFVDAVAPSGAMVRARDSVVVRTLNPALGAERAEWEAGARRAELERMRALTDDLNTAKAWEARAAATHARLAEAKRKEDGLVVRPPIDGVWLSERRARDVGAFVEAGALLGRVESEEPARVRVPVREPVAAAIFGAEDRGPIRARVRSATGRGGVCAGVLDRVVQSELGAQRSRSRVFEAIIDVGGGPIRVGERVIVRLELPRTPLLPRWIASVQRSLLSRDLPGADPR
jgi:hypothetical protein